MLRSKWERYYWSMQKHDGKWINQAHLRPQDNPECLCGEVGLGDLDWNWDPPQTDETMCEFCIEIRENLPEMEEY